MKQTRRHHSKMMNQKSKIKSQKMAIIGFSGVKDLMKWSFGYPHFSSPLNAKSSVEEGSPAHLFMFFHEAY
jgi:hypothetical protein